MKPTLLKGIVVGGIAGLLCSAATVALAGSGVGGIFNLGQTNTVDAQSSLAGTTGNAQLYVQNKGGGRGIAAFASAAQSVYAHSMSGDGVDGESSSGPGVAGNSSSQPGVVGVSTSSNGVTGTSKAAGYAGVNGVDVNGGTGVLGSTYGSNGTAVKGTASAGRGVAGFSNTWQGVYGHSDSQAGVVGDSNTFDGVFGQTHTKGAAGVSGHNLNGGFGLWGSGGIGVYGEGPYAFQANGDAVQNRAGGGWIKAMAWIDPQSQDPIKQCFNSQAEFGAQESFDCQFSFSSNLLGQSTIDFGFRVSDRFVTVTPMYDGGDIGAELTALSGNTASIRTFYSSVSGSGNNAQPTYAPFVVVVY